MSQNSSPDNVPSATKGTADSLAAPGRVGAGGTKRVVIFLALLVLFAFVSWLAIFHIELFLLSLGVAVVAQVAWCVAGEIEKLV